MAVKVLVKIIAALREGIANFDRQIAAAVAAHPDFAIFDSLPGVGAVMTPRLLAAFGSQGERYAGPDDVQTYSGIAPVTGRSGKTSGCIFAGLALHSYGRILRLGTGLLSAAARP